MEFRWNAWNVEHATGHGVSIEEAEHVVRFPRPPYPRDHRKGTLMVVGRGNSNRVVRVVFTLDPDETVHVIHAMPMGGRRRKRGR